MYNYYVPIKNLYLKKGGAVLFFVAWLFIALLNPIAISTFLISFLALIIVTFTFFCRCDYRINIWVFLLFLLFIVNFSVNGLFVHKESIRWFLVFWTCFLSIYFLLKACGEEVILRIYKKTAVLISIFCIIQQFSFLLGLDFIYDLSWIGIESRVTFSGPLLRVTAFFAEPAHLGFFLMYPAFMAIMGKKNISDLLVIIAFVMTFSIGNYIMLMLLLTGYYTFIQKKINIKIFSMLFIIVVSIITLLSFMPELSEKFNSITAVGDELLLSQNRSKAAPYFLFFVNLNSLIENPFFGNGFGTRLDIYEMYLPDLLGNAKNPYLFFSDELFFAKIMGEMGSIGLIVFFFIFYNRWLTASKNNKIFFFVFLIVSLKSGSYFNPALFFFLNMYFVKEKQNRL